MVAWWLLLFFPDGYTCTFHAFFVLEIALLHRSIRFQYLWDYVLREEIVLLMLFSLCKWTFRNIFYCRKKFLHSYKSNSCWESFSNIEANWQALVSSKCSENSILV